MARKRSAISRRKKSSNGGGKKTLALIVVLVAVVAGYFLWQQSQQAPAPAPAKKKPVAPTQPHLPIPPRVAPQPQISSVSVPVERPQPVVVPQQKGAGKVAIIVDDMGASMQELQGLLSIKLPVTFSVIPSLAHARGVAEAAHRAGADVMVHMPMEPEGYPKQPMEKIGLLVAMENPEIEERVTGYFRNVPYAVGANNHMGSRFTQNKEKMEVVLKVLKEKGVFFVDSKTSPASVGYRTARQLGLICAERQVFLDNVQDERAISKQLAQAVAIARKRGEAIAICHPHPATIRALHAAMPAFAKSGISFVYISRLVN